MAAKKKSRHTVTSREYRKNSKTNEMFIGIILILFGAIVAICGQGFLNIAVAVAGALLIVLGALIFAETGNANPALFNIVIGLLFMILGVIGLAATLIRLLFGVLIILVGIFMLLGSQPTFMGYKIVNTKSAAMNAVIGVVLILLGVIAAINYAGSFDLLIRFIGVAIIVLGALNIGKAAKLVDL